MNATIKSNNKEQSKLDLLNAIEKSYLYDSDNNDEQHPVITYLSEMNSKQNGGGWLFQLGARMSSHSRTNNDIFLATALYSIIGCGCNSDYCEVLVDALEGSTATKK